MPFGGLSAFPSLDYFSGAKITVRSLPRRDVATGQVTRSVPIFWCFFLAARNGWPGHTGRPPQGWFEKGGSVLQRAT